VNYKQTNFIFAPRHKCYIKFHLPLRRPPAGGGATENERKSEQKPTVNAKGSSETPNCNEIAEDYDFEAEAHLNIIKEFSPYRKDIVFHGDYMFERYVMSNPLKSNQPSNHQPKG
jgi:hypothetical protein